MNRIYMIILLLLLVVVFSYYGANIIYKKTEVSSDENTVYKEYKEYRPENISVETGITNMHDNNIALSYVIGKPDEKEYPYEFFLKAYDNHIAIFNKEGSLYEYTGIVINSLDETTRNNISKGLYFKEIEDLFTFLESCSS